MKKTLFAMMLLVYPLLALSSHECVTKIAKYKLVENSIKPFTVDNKKACFFAFYTPNPSPEQGSTGNGNLGDAIWYGYYEINTPNVINEFPKPPHDDNNLWALACSIRSVSFLDMNGDRIPDVTVIAACHQNAVNYNFPFIFIRQGNKYVLNEEVYNDLFEFISLSISDLRAYSASPSTYYKYFDYRYQLH